METKDHQHNTSSNVLASRMEFQGCPSEDGSEAAGVSRCLLCQTCNHDPAEFHRDPGCLVCNRDYSSIVSVILREHTPAKSKHPEDLESQGDNPEDTCKDKCEMEILNVAAINPVATELESGIRKLLDTLGINEYATSVELVQVKDEETSQTSSPSEKASLLKPNLQWLPFQDKVYEEAEMYCEELDNYKTYSKSTQTAGKYLGFVVEEEEGALEDKLFFLKCDDATPHFHQQRAENQKYKMTVNRGTQKSVEMPIKLAEVSSSCKLCDHSAADHQPINNLIEEINTILKSPKIAPDSLVHHFLQHNHPPPPPMVKDNDEGDDEFLISIILDKIKAYYSRYMAKSDSSYSSSSPNYSVDDGHSYHPILVKSVESFEHLTTLDDLSLDKTEYSTSSETSNSEPKYSQSPVPVESRRDLVRGSFENHFFSMQPCPRHFGQVRKPDEHITHRPYDYYLDQLSMETNYCESTEPSSQNNAGLTPETQSTLFSKVPQADSRQSVVQISEDSLNQPMPSDTPQGANLKPSLENLKVNNMTADSSSASSPNKSSSTEDVSAQSPVKSCLPNENLIGSPSKVTTCDKGLYSHFLGTISDLNVSGSLTPPSEDSQLENDGTWKYLIKHYFRQRLPELPMTSDFNTRKDLDIITTLTKEMVDWVCSPKRSQDEGEILTLRKMHSNTGEYKSSNELDSGDQFSNQAKPLNLASTNEEVTTNSLFLLRTVKEPFCLHPKVEEKTTKQDELFVVVSQKHPATPAGTPSAEDLISIPHHNHSLQDGKGVIDLRLRSYEEFAIHYHSLSKPEGHFTKYYSPLTSTILHNVTSKGNAPQANIEKSGSEAEQDKSIEKKASSLSDLMNVFLPKCSAEPEDYLYVTVSSPGTEEKFQLNNGTSEILIETDRVQQVIELRSILEGQDVHHTTEVTIHPQEGSTDKKTVTICLKGHTSRPLDIKTTFQSAEEAATSSSESYK